MLLEQGEIKEHENKLEQFRRTKDVIKEPENRRIAKTKRPLGRSGI